MEARVQADKLPANGHDWTEPAAHPTKPGLTPKRHPLTNPIKLVRANAGLSALLLASFLLLLSWSFVVPIFEAPDEPEHWHYARYLHDHASLPIYSSALVEANEPPLYYGLVAPFAIASETPPHLAFPDAAGGNIFPFSPRLYQDANDDLQHYWPIRLGRLLSVIVSVITVLFCYLAGVEATRKRATGLLTGGLVAFLPAFTFRGMNVSADALVATLSAATIYLMVRLVNRGFSWRLGLVTAAVLAFACLAKINAICLAPAVFLAILWAGDSKGQPWGRRCLRSSVLVLAGLILSPWLIRNQVLYGDPLASGAMARAVPGLIERKSLSSPYFTGMFPNFTSRSLVGVFGWMNIWLNEWIYRVFALLGLAALWGLLWRSVDRRSDSRLILILASIPLLNLVLLVDFNLTLTQPQGRYLFPSLAALALLVSLGLEGLPGWARRARWLNPSTVGAAGLLNVLILLTVVRPAYWPPITPQISDRQLVLQPSSASELQGTALGRPLVVAGTQPHLDIKTNVDTGLYNFLIFNIQARANTTAVGTISFATNGRALQPQQAVPFAWLAGGTPRTVTVALRRQPGWSGRLTLLRIAPFADAAQAHIGQKIEITNLKLVGSLGRDVL